MTDFRDLMKQRCPLRTVMTLALKGQGLRFSKTDEEFFLQHKRQSFRKL
jgi:hypothetical protein